MTDMAENRTDLGNARRLVRLHGDHLRYVHTWATWLVFDGRRWRKDATAEIDRLAKATALSIYREAADAGDEPERQALAKWAVATESERRLRALVSVATSEPEVVAEARAFDADPWLFNVANGTLDLRTGCLRPHAAENLITRQTPVEYDPAAAAPRFAAFLARVVPQPEMREFLQRAIGYSLTGLTTEQCLFFCYGHGANGKSVLLEVLRALFGEYAMQADFSTFLLRRSEGPRNDLVRLDGARLVTASEIADGQRLDESLMKSLTGGDVIAARQLYREAVEFHLQAKFVLAANHKPIVRGRDHAIWRRFRLVPFTVTIPEEERDPQLADRLREELPGILAWAVEGCLAWQRDGLAAPAEVLTATEDYRAEMDVLGAFIAERCQVANGVSVQAAVLYAAYRAWATQGHEELLSSTRFGREMATRFPKAIVPGGRIAYFGIMVQPDSCEGLGGFEGSSVKSPHEEVTEGSYRNAPSTLTNPHNATRGAEITPIAGVGRRDFDQGDAWEGDDTLGRGAA